MQSASGLALGLFMWGHMFFVSSILLGTDAMWAVTKFFEGYFFFGRAMPILVSGVVAVVLALFIGHALLAVRKFPINYRQYRAYADHKADMRHPDTTMWWWQVVTGFALFFLASVHLYVMLVQPETIGPYGSADRMWSGGFWRLTQKWGWFAGKDDNATRARLKTVKWALTAFFLVLGLATLAAYVKIGIEHAPNAGQPYPTPAWALPGAK
jgi:fumarate reductase subunit C